MDSKKLKQYPEALPLMNGGLKSQKDNQHDFKNCNYVSSF